MLSQDSFLLLSQTLIFLPSPTCACRHWEQSHGSDFRISKILFATLPVDQLLCCPCWSSPGALDNPPASLLTSLCLSEQVPQLPTIRGAGREQPCSLLLLLLLLECDSAQCLGEQLRKERKNLFSIVLAHWTDSCCAFAGLSTREEVAPRAGARTPHGMGPSSLHRSAGTARNQWQEWMAQGGSECQMLPKISFIDQSLQCESGLTLCSCLY